LRVLADRDRTPLLLAGWLAGLFVWLNCFHAGALAAFGVVVLGLRLAIVDRLRKCPHGIRGAISSPPLCPTYLAEKKAREHADRIERKRRGRERAEAREASPGGD